VKTPGEVTAKNHVGEEIVFDGEWLEIRRMGLMSRMAGERGTKRLHISSITAVQLKEPGILGGAGYVEFTLPGGVESKSPGARSGRNENAVSFLRKVRPAFVAVRDAVEEAIVTSRQPVAPAPTPSASSSLHDEIEKLAAQRERGLLTEEEFSQAKRRLLSE
jgi:hypothetical protein